MSIKSYLNPDQFPKDRWDKRIIKILKEKQEKGEFRTTKFFYDWMVKNRFDFYLDPSEFANQMDVFITLLKEYFGTNWEVFIEPTSTPNKYSINILLLYPEKTIRNSINETHVISDLVVCLKIIARTNVVTLKKHMAIGTNITGSRLSLSIPELDSNYYHSHLPAANSPKLGIPFVSFCKGSGTDLDLLLMEPSHNDDFQFDQNYIERLFFSLDSFLEWESLESIPFKKIKDVVEIYKRPETSYNYEMYASLAKQFISEEKYLGSLRLYVENNRYKVDPNVLEDKIKEFFKEVVLTYAFVVIKEGEVFERRITTLTEEEIQQRIENENLEYKIFIQEEKKVNIIPSKNTEIDPNSLSVHPKIIEYAKNKIESYIYQQQIRIGRVANQN